MSERIRKIEWTPAYDKRSADPTNNYGVHGVEMRWLLTGDEGTIQFVVSTNWHLPNVEKELDARDSYFPHLSCHPMAYDIGYHARIPKYDGQDKMSDNCPYLKDGGVCYYDGSSLRAEDFLNILISQGEEAVWHAMAEEYECQLLRKESGDGN